MDDILSDLVTSVKRELVTSPPTNEPAPTQPPKLTLKQMQEQQLQQQYQQQASMAGFGAPNPGTYPAFPQQTHGLEMQFNQLTLDNSLPFAQSHSVQHPVTSELVPGPYSQQIPTQLPQPISFASSSAPEVDPLELFITGKPLPENTLPSPPASYGSHNAGLGNAPNSTPYGSNPPNSAPPYTSQSPNSLDVFLQPPVESHGSGDIFSETSSILDIPPPDYVDTELDQPVSESEIY
jgi:hypothetical protein